MTDTLMRTDDERQRLRRAERLRMDVVAVADELLDLCMYLPASHVQALRAVRQLPPLERSTDGR